MDRETWIPLLGLLGLAIAGGGMLYATSGKTPGPPDLPVAPKGTKTKAKGAEELRLLQNKGIGDRDYAAEGSPNVVVVVGCTLRRDALGPYGGPETLTPRMTELAAQGARFDDALAAGVWSKEALTALITGRHAVELGVVEPLARPSARTLDQSATTLAEVFQANGYWTIGVNSSPAVNKPSSALWQGFDYTRDAHPEGWKAQHRLTAVHAVQQSLRMMNEAPGGRPFYMQLVLSDSHRPWRVPQAEADPWKDLPNPFYMATVRRADDALGILMAWLDTMDLRDNTYLVFVGDHGEGLDRPKHHGPAHGRYLAGSTAQIPWIVRGPGIPAGATIEGLASGVDFAPTVLGLAGIEGGLDDGVSGIDLSGVLQSGGQTSRTEAFVDTWYLNANRASVWTRTTQCQKDFGSIKLDDDGFLDGCYDRGTDPDFERPIERPELMATLEAWRAERPGPAVGGEGGKGRKAPGEAPATGADENGEPE